MVYKKKGVFVLIITACSVLLSSCVMGIGNSSDRASKGTGSTENSTALSPEEKVEQEKNKYVTDAKAIDYVATFSGFVLTPFHAKPNIATLSGSVLILGKKTLTGSILYEKDVSIYERGGNWYYKKKSVTQTSGTNMVIAEKDRSDSGEYQLRFLDGFSKMRFLGKTYAHDQKNLTKMGQSFDLDLFVKGSDAYVVQLENAQEKASRQKLRDEYDKKLAEIKQQYSSDPYMANKLASELTRAYDMRADRF